MPVIGAVLFLAIIVVAWNARAARIEDHQTGRTP
jgi:hypothetical protein